MSTRLKVYVGPYLECQEMMVESTETIRSCSNAACPAFMIERYGIAAFCDHCGSPIADREISVQAPAVEAYGFLDSIDQALFPRSIKESPVVLWLPDAYRDRPRIFEIEDETVIPISSDDRTGEVAWFVEAFRAEILAIKSAYGTTNVDIRWGIVSYYQ